MNNRGIRNSLDVHVTSDRAEVKRKIWKVNLKRIIENIGIIIFLIYFFIRIGIPLILLFFDEMLK